MPVYRFYELRVSSSRPLWNTAPIAVDSRAEADIMLSFVQAGEPMPAWTNASWSIVRELQGRDWTMSFSLPAVNSEAVLRLHIRQQSDETTIVYGQNAARIVVAWCSAQRDFDAVWPDLSSWAMGALLGFAMCLRGLPTLHGSAVGIDGRAIGLLGVSGAGKSTLAAAFVAAGHAMLTDDHLVMRHDPSGWHVLPGPPRLRLWPASLAALGTREPEHSLVAGGDGKHLFDPPPSVICTQPLPVAALYILAPRDPSRSEFAIEPLPPAGALNALMNQRFCMTSLSATHTEKSLAALAALVPHVPVRMLYRPNGLETLSSIVDALRRDAIGHGC